MFIQAIIHHRRIEYAASSVKRSLVCTSVATCKHAMRSQESVNGWNNGHLVQFAMIRPSKPHPFTILISGDLYVGLTYGLLSVNLGDLA